MNTYKAIDVARIFGIHVSTVRLYEKYGLIPKPERRSNGYRIFTDIHIEQFRLARAALQVEVLQKFLIRTGHSEIKMIEKNERIQSCGCIYPISHSRTRQISPVSGR